MTTGNSPTYLAGLALQSAAIPLNTAAATQNCDILATNLLAIHHAIVQLKLTTEPAQARKYLFFRPFLVARALNAIRSAQRADTEGFLREHAPDYLLASLSSNGFDHDSAPLAYKQRSERVIDKIDVNPCRRCNGNGQYTETRTKTGQVPCAYCSGTGGRYITKLTYSPGRTDHGAPTQVFESCSYCSGTGTTTAATGTYLETVRCYACGGTGQIEKKYYRKETVFIADTVRSTIKRDAQVQWPPALKKPIDAALLDPDMLLKSCTTLKQAADLGAAIPRIDVTLQLAVKIHTPATLGPRGRISEITQGADSVLFSDTPLLDPFLKTLAHDLSSRAVLDARAKTDLFLAEMLKHTKSGAAPSALAPQLGFMASPTAIGALLRRLRWVTRYRRLAILYLIVLPLIALALYAFGAASG
jgi:hypothetical protein